jgi:hypothetical protein
MGVWKGHGVRARDAGVTNLSKIQDGGRMKYRAEEKRKELRG